MFFIDSLTHIVLGASVGEAIAGKKLGKRAMFLGALAQSIPDVDFISALWNDTASNLLAHRGFTHSLLFGVIATVLFALLAEHYHKRHQVGYKTWVMFFSMQIGIHLLLDFFNSYGLGLFEPFNHVRVSMNALFVADPFFSIWPAIAFIALLILKKGDRRRNTWWRFGVIACSIYLLYCSVNKIKIDNDVKEILSEQKINNTDYFTTPSPLNNWLWYVAVKDSAGYYIGYRSVFDRKRNFDFHYFPQNDSLLNPIRDHEEIQHLLRFSQGFYTVEKWHDTLVFNDLRFGQMVGWHDPNEKFVFHYFLQHSDAANRLVVQRGRFAKWNTQTTKAMLKRIAGN
ncbi:MAG: metal-dependent hydrolase [Flavisolibacter sp.]